MNCKCNAQKASKLCWHEKQGACHVINLWCLRPPSDWKKVTEHFQGTQKWGVVMRSKISTTCHQPTPDQHALSCFKLISINQSSLDSNVACERLMISQSGLPIRCVILQLMCTLVGIHQKKDPQQQLKVAHTLLKLNETCKVPQVMSNEILHHHIENTPLLTSQPVTRAAEITHTHQI